MLKLSRAAGLWVALGGFLVWTACSNIPEAGFGPRSVKAAVKPDKERKSAPEFALKDSNGQTVHLTDYKGKVVLLDFWATWCGPCKVEIPWFIEFEQQFKNRGFAVIGVSMDEEGWDAVKPYIDDHKINYRVLLGNEQVSDIYGGLDSLPTTLLIDRQGKIASVHIGLSLGKEEFRDDIDHLLGASSANLSNSDPLLTAAK
ncbi:MAG TPA: redoxin domain-containing protein [Bryobacteraceae bacterium]|nr:redoxin domain-containing protein [Bryobacteraceae bacterium]